MVMIKRNNYFHLKKSSYEMLSTFKNIDSMEKLSKTFAYPEFYQAEQIHSDNISVIDQNKFFYKKADGLITFNKLNYPILIRTADCVPLFFFSKIRNIYGLIHAGRRGTEKRISSRLVKILKNKGLHPEEFRFLIGPSICPDCYEIDREKKLNYDLWNTNKQQLIESGVNEKDIFLSNICTKTTNELFSYREDKTDKRIYNLIFQNPIQL